MKIQRGKLTWKRLNDANYALIQKESLVQQLRKQVQGLEEELKQLKSCGRYVNDDTALAVSRMVEANAQLTIAFSKAMTFPQPKGW